jgi:hypothetical protein
MITLHVVQYGCETWSLTLRKEHRLGVFENRVLRRIFGPKRDEVTGEWKKLHNEDLCNFFLLFTNYNYNDQVEKDEMGGLRSTNGREEERL